MNRYTVTDSKGQVFKRGSRNRTYTHCIVAEWSTGRVESSWAGTPELAEARRRTFENKRGIIGTQDKHYGHVWQSEVVRVEVIEAVPA